MKILSLLRLRPLRALVHHSTTIDSVDRCFKIPIVFCMDASVASGSTTQGAGE